MKITDTKIKGVQVVETAPIGDNRGSFTRWFCMQELAPVIGKRAILNVNHSKTVNKGSIRGIHYQKPPHGEMKLIRCIKGRVWDVALDLRKGSPTFLQWHAEELSAENGKMLVIPEYCGHGFQVLEPESEMLYLHTAFYEKSSEGGVRHNDPKANIKWPLPPADLSERDKGHPLLAADFQGIGP